MILVLGLAIGVSLIQLREAQNKLSEVEAELEKLKESQRMKELEKVKGELLKLQNEIKDLLQELNETKTKLSETEAIFKLPPPPKIVGKISFKEIQGLIEEIVGKGKGGCITFREEYNVTTTEEINRFLMSLKRPENLSKAAEPWYLSAKFVEWGGNLAVGYGFGWGKLSPFTLFISVIVVAQNEKGEYQLFWIDENRLVAFEPGDLDILHVIFS